MPKRTNEVFFAEDLTQQEAPSKKLKKQPIAVKPIPLPKNFILDNLNKFASLLQKNNKCCASVMLINNKLLIADNEIYAGNNENHANINFIKTVMAYFIKLAQSNDQKQKELMDDREKIVEKIFERQFSEGCGYLSAVKEYYENILASITTALEFIYENHNETEIVAKIQTLQTELKKLVKGNRRQIGLAFDIGCRIIRQIKNVEKFLLNEVINKKLFSNITTENNFAQRIITYSSLNDPAVIDVNWLKNPDTRGFGILAIGEKGVHTESKSIDFLLACNIFSPKPTLTEAIYLGISKSCCLHCYDVVTFTNEALRNFELIEKENNFILVSGAHYRKFTKWDEVKPVFLKENKESDKARYSENSKMYQSRINHLANTIKDKFLNKHQEFDITILNNSNKTKAEKYLKSSSPLKKCLIFYKDYNDWFFTGYCYITAAVVHEKFEIKNPLKKNGAFKPSVKNKLISEAQKCLQYEIEKPKEYMSHESDGLYTSEDSENEMKNEKDYEENIDQLALSVMDFAAKVHTKEIKSSPVLLAKVEDMLKYLQSTQSQIKKDLDDNSLSSKSNNSPTKKVNTFNLFHNSPLKIKLRVRENFKNKKRLFQ